MKLSYAITVYNELEEIQRLIPYLLKHKSEEDEIVVLWDNKGPNDIFNYLAPFHESLEIQFHQSYFENNFAEWKNKLTAECSGDFIFQLDADEYPHQFLMENIKAIIEANDAEAYWIPRVNTVEGITEEHIRKWDWKVNEKGWIQWPDVQMRLYKNSSDIEWKGKVHEKIEGYKEYGTLPSEEEFALYHPKTIAKQEKQNQLYETI
jgi:glycosyltransferase involved in cell wall biosynthesis